jgi:hypothetical protein
MTLNKIKEFYTERISVCPIVTSEFHIIAIFKSSIKEDTDSNKI